MTCRIFPLQLAAVVQKYFSMASEQRVVGTSRAVCAHTSTPQLPGPTWAPPSRAQMMPMPETCFSRHPRLIRDSKQPGAGCPGGQLPTSFMAPAWASLVPVLPPTFFTGLICKMPVATWKSPCQSKGISQPLELLCRAGLDAGEPEPWHIPSLQFATAPFALLVPHLPLYVKYK